jgi:hypothetical protein
VKPAASTELQRESRAAHGTVKATTDASKSGEEHAAELPGVWGAARVKGKVGNVGGPSAQPWSRQSSSYKPMAKLSAAQRKSEGIVVPLMDATKNATGGKGPCFGHDGGGGKREGMTGRMSRSNHPDRNAVDKVLRLRSRLRVRTKRGSQACVHRCDEPMLWDVGRESRTMLLLERPSVSRVLEIGKHGLNGGPAETDTVYDVGESRVYQ